MMCFIVGLMLEPWEKVENYTIPPKYNLGDCENSEIARGTLLGEHLAGFAWQPVWQLHSDRNIEGCLFKGVRSTGFLTDLVRNWIQANGKDARMLMGEGEDEKPLEEFLYSSQADQRWGLEFPNGIHTLHDVINASGASQIRNATQRTCDLFFPISVGELARRVRLWYDQIYSEGFRNLKLDEAWSSELPPYDWEF